MKITQDEVEFTPIRIVLESNKELQSLHEILFLAQEVAKQGKKDELNFIITLIDLLDQYI